MSSSRFRIRGASPLGLPDTLSRAPLRRRAPFAWLARCARSRPAAASTSTPIASASRRNILLLLFAAASVYATDARAPLADAAEKLDRVKVRALLTQHADVNTPQPDGMTALHWAAYQDDLDLT